MAIKILIFIEKKFGWKVSSLLQICLIIVLISQNVYEKIFIILVSNF